MLPNRDKTPEEIDKEIKDSEDVYEMTRTAGWENVVKPMLEQRMYHAWIDPRDAKHEKEFLWQELGLFFARDAARQLLEDINDIIEAGNTYKKEKKEGEQEGRMKI